MTLFLRQVSSYLSALVFAGAAIAIEPGQVDTFDDETTNGWDIGPAAEPNQRPTSEPDCGEDGMGDSCLRTRSTGEGRAGSRLAVYNEDQWTGDYNAAGVIGLKLRARNALFFAPLDLRLRIDGPGEFVVSRDSALLVPEGEYVTATFFLEEGRFTGEAGVLEAILNDVTRVWLYHSRSPSWPPPKEPHSLRLDDIEALVNEIFTSGFE